MTRILVAGDTHGSADVADYLQKMAYRENCDLIIQVGDWGYFWCGKDRVPNLWRTQVKKDFRKPVWFLPGNHEDYNMLEELQKQPKGEIGWPAGEEVTYLGRVNRFEIDGVSFLSVGGAVSVDKAHRTQFVTWFPQESITYAEVEEACAGGLVDIMLSHDAPSTPKLIDHLSNFYGVPYKLEQESENNRRAIEAILDEVRPKYLYHGHYHKKYTTTYRNTIVTGLGMNGDGPSSWVVFDTKMFRGVESLWR